MKTRLRLLTFGCGALLATSTWPFGAALSPAATENPAAQTQVPATGTASSRAKDEQQKRLQEWRRQNPEDAARMDRFQSMTVEQRRAAFDQWQKQNPVAASRAEQFRQSSKAKEGLAGAQQVSRQEPTNEMLRKWIHTLQKKDAEGGLTEVERRQLERLQRVIQTQDKTAKDSTVGPQTPTAPSPRPAVPTTP
jgi:hypothetical protein